jgi:hypothetical protein
MDMKKKPQGKFVAGKVEAPRKITIRGETHYLVYVTPEEAKDLKKAGGSGEAGPKGIPAFRKGGGRSDRGRSSSKDKVDKATGAKSSGKSTGGSNKSGGPTEGRGSEKSTPAPRDRDDRQPTPAPKSTPAPAPRDRDDRQPVAKPAPAPKTLTRSITAPAPPPKNDGPSAAEKAAAAARVQSLADAKERAKAFADAKAKAEAEAQALKSTPKPATRSIVVPNSNADSKAKAAADKAKADAEDLAMAQAVLPKVGPNPKMTTIKDAATVAPPVVTNTKVATGKYTPTINPETGAVTDRLGNPVVTNARGYGYLDPITGLAVPPGIDEVNGGGPGYGGAALGSGGGAALDTNKDNYISEAEIAAGKAKGLELEQNAWSKLGTGLGITPRGSGIDPTGLAKAFDSGILGFARKLDRPSYTRPASSIAPGQKLNKWWEADKNALGFAYGTQDQVSQRAADAVRAAAILERTRSQQQEGDNVNGPVAPIVPIVTTPPTYTENASSPFAPIPNPNYNPADPMSLAYLTNPSYEELLAYRNSGTTPARPFAKGGIANLVKDGGNEKTIISDAIRAVEGKMSERDAAISLAKFVKAHGEPALRDLVDKVSSGEYADTRERFANGENGMVRGPGNGSGTDDKVPATIDGEQDVLLADGEMVLRKKTTDAIEKAYPGLLDRINAAEGDAPKVLAKALDFIEGRNRRG